MLGYGTRDSKGDAIERAVILARGLGTRMRRADASAPLDADQSAAADTGVKAMIPVGRPFLDYVLSALADAGYREVCLVVGPEHQSVRDYYTVQSPPERTRISFATQKEPLGTADAVAAAEDFAAGEDFLVINSDNDYPVSALDALRRLGETGTVLFEREALSRNSNIPPERIRSFAVCVVGSDGYLQSILEKPDEAALRAAASTSLVSMNCWRFSEAIFAACHDVPRSVRGELELPKAVELAISRGDSRFRVVSSSEGVLDISTRGDIAAVAERLRGRTVRP
ncbi:MAG TPA: sugar phosphate nucleotidyltransferase [Thermoanaerobaculia bacterium]